MVKKKKPDPEDFKKRLKESLEQETDRGLAIVGAAFLDDAIEKLLRAFFVDDSTKATDLLSQNGPLATFSSRCKAAYCLGLIGPNMFEDLRIIRKIRNAFAHDYFDVDFTNQSVTDLSGNLRIPKLGHRESQKEPRDRFIFSVTLIAYHCLEKAKKTKHREKGPDYHPISHTIPGSVVVGE